MIDSRIFFHIPQLVKSLPFYIPEAWKRSLFRADPPRIDRYTEYLLPGWEERVISRFDKEKWRNLAWQTNPRPIKVHNHSKTKKLQQPINRILNSWFCPCLAYVLNRDFEKNYYPKRAFYFEQIIRTFRLFLKCQTAKYCFLVGYTKMANIGLRLTYTGLAMYIRHAFTRVCL